MKLVSTEISAPPAAARSINEYLHANVTLSRPRGLEAIKHLRRRDRYKSMLAQVQSSNSSLTLANNVEQSRSDNIESPNPDLLHVVTYGSVCCPECRRVFPSSRSLAQHRRHAHPPENPPSPSSPDFNCQLCSRAFSTSQGLGLHVKRTHPEAANEAIVLPANTPWHDEDINRLARAELAAPASAQRFINQYLHDQAIVSRPQSSISYIRKTSRYRNVRDSLREANPSQPIPQLSTSAIGVQPPQQSETNNQLPLEFRDYFENLETQIQANNLLANGSQFLLDAVDALKVGLSPEPFLRQWYELNFPATIHYRTPVINTEPSDIDISRSQRRRREYARIQTLWKKNSSKAARVILDGAGSDSPSPSMSTQEAFWRPILELPSTPFVSPVLLADALPKFDDLCGPISPNEVTSVTLKQKSSPGPDGIKPSEWSSRINPVISAALMNIILCWGHIPSFWRDSRTILVPKSTSATQPAEFRPISISSVFLRHLHRIISNRILGRNAFDERQRGFIHADGTSENVAVYATLLDEANRTNKSIHIVSIDAQKAFDTVSHEALSQVLQHRGFSNTFRTYFQNLYLESQTRIEINGEYSEPIKPRRGVRQGDPFSSIAFNLIMDEVLVSLDQATGFDLDGTRVNALCFADDLDLISSTVDGMQSALDRVASTMAAFGLTPAPRKCSAISLMAAGKIKKVKVMTEPLFRIAGYPVKQLGFEDTWKHLGVNFTLKGPSSPIIDLQTMLGRISSAPLKPQQRLVLLRTFLIPRYMHGLVLGKVTFGLLERMDKQNRSAIKRWLKLPHDVPSAFFHAPVESGGLGIFSFLTGIPELVRKRIESLAESSFSAAVAARRSSWASKRLQWTNSLPILNLDWASRLHGTTDGSELKQCQASILSHAWIYGNYGIPPRSWLEYIRVRINALPSRTRTSRGVRRSTMETQCRALCSRLETAYHIVQQCHRTHGGRILRHNAIVDALVSMLASKGYQTWKEPHIRTSAGLRKPDILAKKGSSSVILDAQVVAGGADLDIKHRAKRDYYANNVDLLRSVAELTSVPVNNIVTSSATISWRGVWSRQSANFLRGLGLPKSKLIGLTTRVLYGSYLNFVRFNSSTTVAQHNIWPFRTRRNL